MAEKKRDTRDDDAPKVTTEDAQDALANTSSDAEHSTYREVKPDTDERPKPGRQVEQERGTPSESKGD